MRLLLVGLLLGTGLGYGLAQLRDGGRRERSRTRTVTRPPTPRLEPRPDPPEPETATERSKAPRFDPTDIRAIPNGAMGRLDVLVTGTSYKPEEIDVLAPSDVGSWHWSWARPFATDSTTARYRIWPGQYRVRWYDSQELERHTLATVRVGELTVVSIREAELVRSDPIRKGRSRLRVTVFDVEGEPLEGVEVELYIGVADGFEKSEIETGPRGAGTRDLRPTTVRLRLGGQRQEAVLLEGQETHVQFRCHTEGELRIAGGVGGRMFLTRPDESKAPIGRSLRTESSHRVVYVPPGEYDLRWRLRDEPEPRLLQRVRIEAARATELKPRYPSGGVELAVQGGPDTSVILVSLRRIGSGDPPRAIHKRLRLEKQGAFASRVRFVHIPPGRWRLRTSASSYEETDEEIVVGSRILQHSIKLRLLSR